jgi:GNAT-family acetyltransferase (TIGR03103 family)
MSRCDDKSVTRRLLSEAGLSVPAQRIVTTDDEARDFLDAHDHVVVKPARGEQGAGISVDLEKWGEVKKALKLARQHADKVLMEEYVTGQDLRIIVIDYKVVAAAIRRPARVVGNGRDTVERLIEKQSRRRAAATGGESKIPTDAETERCLKAAGYAYDDVPAEGEAIIVRKTANLHTGGTIHDVTDRLHPRLIDAAVRGAQALDIPVVGFDFLVPDITGPDYAIIEANERPGLANHEPQPTAERFIDLLFPQTIVR